MAPSSGLETQFTLRRACKQDCAGLARVQVESYRASYVDMFPPDFLENLTLAEQEQDWRDWLAANPTDVLLTAAAASGEVCGYVLARVQVDAPPDYSAEVLALHVSPAQRGRGIGRALLRGALIELQQRGCANVMLWTLEGNPIRRWYERLGGQKIDCKTWDMDGWLIHEVAYDWDDLSALIVLLDTAHGG